MDTEEMTFPRPDGHEQILLYPVYESLIYIYIYILVISICIIMIKLYRINIL